MDAECAGRARTFFTFVGAFLAGHVGTAQAGDVVVGQLRTTSAAHRVLARRRAHGDLEPADDPPYGAFDAGYRQPASFPLQTSHTWYRLRPMRAILMLRMIVSCLSVTVTLLSESSNDRYYAVPARTPVCMWRGT